MHTSFFLKNYLTDFIVIVHKNGFIVSIGFESNTTCSIPASLNTSVTIAPDHPTETFEPTCIGIHISFKTKDVCLYTHFGS
jgi:hypothetical protein